jgi:1-acyl-sn-glycerol-3-phosphate acyltransferase
MLALRSLVFNALFYAVIVVMVIVGLPVLASPRWTLAYARLWGRISVWLLRVVCGTRLVFRGTPPGGGALVAAKHQSFLETFALLTVLDRPTYVLKRELTWLPLFGWYLLRSGMVPIDRGAGARTFPMLNARAAEAVASGRQLIIFPEGTRRPPGAPPAHKAGVAHLYRALGVACTPVALDTGVFWPRRKFLRRPGVAVIEFLEPIPPGLPREVFSARLGEAIEAGSNRLLREAGTRA